MVFDAVMLISLCPHLNQGANDSIDVLPCSEVVALGDLFYDIIKRGNFCRENFLYLPKDHEN